MTTSNATAAAARHPAGLQVIFMAEMWERFSYYGMRALLVLYLVNAIGYQRADALQVYGLYTGLVYLTPLLGGYIADRWLGTRLAAVIGGAVMMLGHFAMAFEPLLNVALGLLIVGNGLFKPNTTSMVGMLYAEDDPRRAGGYTIFYMGVNVGAFLAPLVAGTLGERLGWHWGFASAGVGMAFGLVAMLRRQALLGRAGLREGQAHIGWKDLPTALAWCLGSAVLVVAVLAFAKVAAAPWAALPGLGKLALGAAVLAAVAWLPGKLMAPQARQPVTPAEVQRMLAIGLMAFFVIFFWMGFEQAGGSMTLFADEQTDRHLLGWEIPASWFQAINPVAILLMAPLFSILWLKLDQSRYALPDPAKMGLGMIVLGLGFVVMAMAQTRAQAAGTVGPLWLTSVYVLHTIGELMLSPVGYSMVSRVAPARLVGLLMGVWLAGIGVANYLAGALEGLLAGSGIDPYVFLLGSSIGAGILLLLITPLLSRMMNRRD
ncbi:peptide MFS transporter [Ideonella sp.]|uniref:peptide MFS transporter n=1 Tax=Ideonella sp. TaxID=1929293 RepID=UPI003BB536EF